MPPRAVVERWAKELLRALRGQDVAAIRVAEAEGGLGVLVQVWPAAGAMPTARGEHRPRPGNRSGCRADILAAVRAAGRPLTRKEVAKALRDAGARHGAGTVAKALAEMTAAGELVNTRDRHGYRLPEWVRPHPTLFVTE